MEGFTIVDAVVAGLILLSAFLAYARGFLRELMAIVSWVAAAVVAYMFAGQVQPLMNEIPWGVGAFLAASCQMSMIIAFFAVLAVGLAVFSLFTPLFSSLIQRSVLGGIDQALGFLFGVLRGILLAAVAFFVYETVITSQDIAMIDDSRTAEILSRYTGQIQGQDPEQAVGWIEAQFDTLFATCEAPVSDET